MDLAHLKQKQLADLLGLEDRSVRNLANEGLPSHGAGKDLFYVWDEVRPWFFEREVKKLLLGRAAGAAAKGELDTLAGLEKRKLLAETELAEMKAAKMAGSQLDAEDTKNTWAGFLSRLRTNIFGLPDRQVSRLDPGMTKAEMLQVLREEVAKTARDIVAAEGGTDAAA